jgi:hypothetical protein
MPDYSNSVVYKICCKDISIKECYVGSTTDLCARKRAHKTDCHNDKTHAHNVPLYKFIRANGGWQNWTMEVLQSYPECASKEELHKYERTHIETLNPSLNREVPGRTQREWYLDNIDQRREYNRKWHHDHKEQMKEYNRKWHEDHREQRLEYMREKVKCEFCGCMSTRGNMLRHQRSQKCLAAQDAEL